MTGTQNQDDLQSIADVLSGISRALARSCEVTLQSMDPEGPHQLRVALRKLRTAAGVFATAVPELAPLGAEARWLGREVGRLRDLDVVRLEVVAPVLARRPDDDGVQALMEAVTKAGNAARDDVRATLSGDRARALLETCETLSDKGKGRLKQPAAMFANRAFDARMAKVRKLGAKFGKLDSTRRHDFRKELKKLRYCFDCGAWPKQGKARRRFLKRLKKLQQCLGDWNDALVAQSVLRSVAKGASDGAGHSAEAIISGHGKRAGKQARKAEELWARLDRATIDF